MAAARTGCENSFGVGFLLRGGGFVLANAEAVEPVGVQEMEMSENVEPTTMRSGDIGPSSWGQLPN